ncbi:CU044_5270 family protein [Actinomadura viridis]|uniref:CU044_5270 family protein n=1 Tax=Actinomadura viridis TaxID=58110 RepID=UPI003689776E
MNDLDILRAAWADTGPPADGARAAARAALLARAGTAAGTASGATLGAASGVGASPAGPPAARRRSFRPFRLPRPALRLVAAGTLAAAIAAGVTIAQTAGGTGPDGRPRAVLPGLPAGPVANAAEALERAAVTAERRAFTPPRPDQWIYLESRRHTSAKAGGVATGGPYATRVVREWKRADGAKTATVRGGRLEILDAMRSTPPQDYPSLAALPTDPDALLAWIYKEMGGLGSTPEGRYETAYAMLGAILRDNVLPPKVEAALYRAIKKIPGVTLVRKVDGAGRPALGLGRVAEGWLHAELLLDPQTFTYLGERSVAVKDHTVSGPDVNTMVKKGTVQLMQTRQAAGIVDRPGQRP